MKPGNLLVVFVCTLALAMTTSLDAMEPEQQGESNLEVDEDAPYLMAFSTHHGPHFVIERADGSDSRIFALM
jgi:hypothetical protein